jgi:hypothetical protein
LGDRYKTEEIVVVSRKDIFNGRLGPGALDLAANRTPARSAICGEQNNFTLDPVAIYDVIGATGVELVGLLICVIGAHIS